ncbi:CLAVATA3/ESR (CLE)-related protein 25-like [Macadamia integrifolia]|uniref:CLAVATA3/ESR (CLE)-related protein 25-like n=1 Tax=Macadamia integrifolia TaxID=60698 RepID=UPI001C4F174E|nr:CLAVATA3/ESR (CLE)-related protein 25-like [Macadamia integrifolia]
MGCGGGSLRVFLISLVFVSFIGFLLVEVQGSGGSKTKTITTSPTGSFKQLELIGTNGPVVHTDVDINYMSKRRVPNGPDPIHNRRAGNSKQPPGRA